MIVVHQWCNLASSTLFGAIMWFQHTFFSVWAGDCMIATEEVKLARLTSDDINLSHEKWWLIRQHSSIVSICLILSLFVHLHYTLWHCLTSVLCIVEYSRQNPHLYSSVLLNVTQSDSCPKYIMKHVHGSWIIHSLWFHSVTCCSTRTGAATPAQPTDYRVCWSFRGLSVECIMQKSYRNKAHQRWGKFYICPTSQTCVSCFK